MVAVAVAVSCRDVLAPTFENQEVRRETISIVNFRISVKIAGSGVSASTVETAAVVCICIFFIIHRQNVRATTVHIGVESHIKAVVVGVVSLGKDLNSHGST